MRILAVGDTKRLADFPDVPTFKEAGIDMVSYNWRGIGGPPRLPKPVVDYWTDVLGKMRETSDWKQGYLARVYQEDGWLVGEQLAGLCPQGARSVQGRVREARHAQEVSRCG